jgi:serine protease inhibitor
MCKLGRVHAKPLFDDELGWSFFLEDPVKGIWSLVIVLLFPFCHCSGQEKKTVGTPTQGNLSMVAPGPHIQVLDKYLGAVVEGNTAFAFDLYRQLAQRPGNKFFSPYSISTALGMTYAGARGNTAKEIAQTLHLTQGNEQLHPAFGELIRKIQGDDKKRNHELAVASSLWADKNTFPLIRSFCA